MTHTVLHIDASARLQDSVSRKMSAQIVANETASKVLRRDLREGLPFLNESWVTGTFTPAENRSAAQNDALTLSDQLVAEVQAADTIVIGSPIYNFGVPAVLKAWIDQIARAGVTFRYTDEGPVGLLSEQKVIVALASGGTKIGSDYDVVTPFLKIFFGFLGIEDVTFLAPEDVDLGAAA